MKTLKIKNIFPLIAGIFILLIAISSCKKDDNLGEAPRLFRPTIKGDLLAPGNYIEASWQSIKDAKSYTVEISRDTFKTIDLSLDIDTNSALIEDLEWDQLYQIQVRANAIDVGKDSKFGILGEVKTRKFPSILRSATIDDVIDNAAIMRWDPSGDPVTEVKVYSGDADKTLIETISLTPTDVSNNYLVVGNLESETSYYLELYSGEKLRGYNSYTTKPGLGDGIIDLRNTIDNPAILQETLQAGVPAGSTIVLKKGFTYTISSGVNLDKTITITSGYDLLIRESASIYFTSNFNFAAGSTIDSISFVDLHLRSDNYGSRYIFNTTNSATVGKIKFDNCSIEIFRGITRLQSGTTTVGNYVIENCLIDSISNYGLLTVDNASVTAENISIRNSTISRAEVVIQSSKQPNGSTSVLIENNTFYRAPRGGSYLVDYNTFTVTNGIEVNNNIFSIGKDNGGNTSPRGIRANASIITSNNYSTLDYVNASNPIPDVIPYPRPSGELFFNSMKNNFMIKDVLFPGRSTAGDPRWRL